MLGVLGTAVVRALLAVRGVGALIWDFLGVSVSCLLLRKLVADVSIVLAVLGEGLVIFVRFPAEMKGCLRAACGFIRRSGSQTRHFDMKSTNSSSSQRRTAARDLEPGRRLLPFELTTGLGAPVVSGRKLA